MDGYTVIGVLIAPIISILLFGVVGAGLRLAIARYSPDGWLKRQLLAERIKSKYSAANARISQEASAHPQGWRHFVGRH